jgi:hypothetical protein
MLGVQDFCGYYDWTFHHFRKHFGDAELKALWAVAIGTDSQRHYIENGRRDGLKGLYETWHHTGEDEQCDWTFTLDESRNVLRWDMRKCPSKGFLLHNNRHADEDYCDHCIGWVKSALTTLGMEMAHHEHNHCGQCWGEMRVKGKPYHSLGLDCDIRKDPRWDAGHIDRFVDQDKAPLRPDVSTSSDPMRVFFDFLAGQRLSATYTTASPGGEDPAIAILSATAYVQSIVDRCVVLIESPPLESTLRSLAAKVAAIAPARQPLLLYPYLPKSIDIPFARYGLPRPLPMLPILIRAGAYSHDPDVLPPSTSEWMERLTAVVNAGIG